MKAKVSVLFYAKKSKSKSDSQVPIYMRITVDGKRAEFSTGKNVKLAKWNTAQNRVKGDSEELRIVNKYLDILQSKFFDIEKKSLF